MSEIEIETPLGPLTVVEDAGSIIAIDWRASKASDKIPVLVRARAQLEEYFAGGREIFDLPLAPRGTSYQRQVWKALITIPYGETRTYGEIAAIAGGSARAVGQANGKNPIPIIIPCHRVVAAGGMGGYSAPGGLDTKCALLALERNEARQRDLFDRARRARFGGSVIALNEAAA